MGEVSREISLDELSRNLMLISIVSFEGSPIGLVTHWDLVFLSRTWAGWALEECGEKPPEEALCALSLIDQWLQDPGSVSGKELSAAAGTAETAAWVAPKAARAARAAAEAAGCAARAAAEAAGAAGAAAWAAAWAAGAAAEAAGAAGAAWAAVYQKQGEFIIEHLKNSSKSSFPSARA